MQFTVASGVYFVASTLFPAKETYVDEAILADEVDTTSDSGKSVDDLEHASVVDKASLEAEVKTLTEDVS